MIDKTVRSAAEALEGVRDGAVVLMGGFGNVGEPMALMDGLIEQGAKDLTVVGIHAGVAEDHVARLVGLGRVRKVIVSWTRSTTPSAFAPLYAAGRIELELVPQGTLAERIRAAGAGFRPSSPPPPPGPSWRRARKPARSTGGSMCWNRRSTPTWR